MSLVPLKVFHSAPFDDQLCFITKNKSYQYSTLDACDVIIHHEVSRRPVATFKLIKELKAQYPTNKKIIIFIIHDFEGKYPKFSNIILIRTSLKASLIQPNEMVMPYIWESAEEPFPISDPTPKPMIGFCGLVSKHRKKLVQVFNASDDVECDFILREKFWGGAPNNAEMAKEFNNNLRDNQYILANRGAGNYSMRFYQALAAGRIPILINTDVKLPFEDKINWANLIILEKDAEACLAKTIKVHQEGRYQEMQKMCSDIFRRFLSKENLFDHISNQLITQGMLVPEGEGSNPNLLYWKLTKILQQVKLALSFNFF